MEPPDSKEVTRDVQISDRIPEATSEVRGPLSLTFEGFKLGARTQNNRSAGNLKLAFHFVWVLCYRA